MTKPDGVCRLWSPDPVYDARMTKAPYDELLWSSVPTQVAPARLKLLAILDRTDIEPAKLASPPMLRQTRARSSPCAASAAVAVAVSITSAIPPASEVAITRSAPA